MCNPTGYGFAPFWSENGIDFAHFSLESGMVFKGTTTVCGRIHSFNFKLVRKKEKYEKSK